MTKQLPLEFHKTLLAFIASCGSFLVSMIDVSFDQLEDLEQSVDRRATGSHWHHSVIKRCTLTTWIRRDGMCFFGSKTVLVNIFSHLDSENYAGDFFNQNPFHDVPYLKPGVGMNDLKGNLHGREIDYAAMHFISRAP